MKELGREEDVATLVAFLDNEQVRHLTGQVIGVTDGIDRSTF